MAEIVTAWQCIGCGRIEAPQPCVGVCQDRRVAFVDAAAFREVVGRAEQTERRAEALLALARRLAATTPREGAWEASFRAFQAEARRTLADLAPSDLALSDLKQADVSA